MDILNGTGCYFLIILVLLFAFLMWLHARSDKE